MRRNRRVGGSATTFAASEDYRGARAPTTSACGSWTGSGAMTLDEEWSVQTERDHVWRGTDLVQRMWAEPPFRNDSFDV